MCNHTNKTIQEELKTKLSQIGELRTRVSSLQAALLQSEHVRKSENQIAQHEIAKLTKNVNEETQKHQKELADCKKEATAQQDELKKYYTELLRQKEEEYNKNLQVVEGRLETEIKSTSKAREGIQTVIDENMSLRNKIRQLESQYTSETYFYKNEFVTLQTTNSNLNSEIECLKEKYHTLKTKHEKLKQENNLLHNELYIDIKKISDLIKQNEENIFENDELKKRVAESEHMFQELLKNNIELTTKKSQLETECGDLKRISKEYLNNRYCNLPDHSNFEALVKQNGVLQELVKSMRQERQLCNNEKHKAERRIEKMEELLAILKEHVLENCDNDLFGDYFLKDWVISK